MILIDTREPSDIELWFDEQKINVTTERRQLDVGDYIIVTDNGTVAVERKTPSDYVNSLYSKHLNNQLYELSRDFTESYLVITGGFIELLFNKVVERNVLISSLISAAFKHANEGGMVSLVQLEGDYDLPLFLGSLHKKVEKGNRFRFPAVHGSKDSKEYVLYMMYQSLPGVGMERAKLLAERFPNVESIVNAHVTDLTDVEGIGKKTAEKILAVLH
jgi:Fanconi anemia group M protein